jgi:sugar lactone lactonase YvrE
VLDVSADCGEGPVWVTDAQRLAWVDTTRPALHLFSPWGAIDRVFPLAKTVGSVVVPAGARNMLLLAGQGGLDAIDLDDGRTRTVLELDLGRPDAFLNDSRCDPAGNLWAGVTTLGETPGAGMLVRITPSGAVTTVLEGLTIPNGMDWSPDGTLFYFVDSPSGRIDVYPFDARDGSLGERRTFAAIGSGDGFPDGLTVDADGFVWVAHWGGSKVSRIAPGGELDRVISLPVMRVSSCTFGGADLCDLYVTTASKDFGASGEADERYGGALFRARVDSPGRPPRRFDRRF